MLIKTAIVENPSICEKCKRFHATDVDCALLSEASELSDKSINNSVLSDTKATKEDFDETAF